jgi:hypothetical protein
MTRPKQLIEVSGGSGDFVIELKGARAARQVFLKLRSAGFGPDELSWAPEYFGDEDLEPDPDLEPDDVDADYTDWEFSEQRAIAEDQSQWLDPPHLHRGVY